jgi:hypothetical protein
MSRVQKAELFQPVNITLHACMPAAHLPDATTLAALLKSFLELIDAYEPYNTCTTQGFSERSQQVQSDKACRSA